MLVSFRQKQTRLYETHLKFITGELSEHVEVELTDLELSQKGPTFLQIRRASIKRALQVRIKDFKLGSH